MMADKKIKYSDELRRFLFELETLTDKKLWERFEEEYADVLDWLWDQAYDKRVNAEHDWQALRIQFLTKTLRERGFDYAEQRAIVYYSRETNTAPGILMGRLYRRKIKEVEMPKETFEAWTTHFNQLVDQHEDEIWDYSPAELNFRDTSD
jgi:hypothetical protein